MYGGMHFDMQLFIHQKLSDWKPDWLSGEAFPSAVKEEDAEEEEKSNFWLDKVVQVSDVYTP